jgi:hypothetical protein
LEPPVNTFAVTASGGKYRHHCESPVAFGGWSHASSAWITACMAAARFEKIQSTPRWISRSRQLRESA